MRKRLADADRRSQRNNFCCGLMRANLGLEALNRQDKVEQKLTTLIDIIMTDEAVCFGNLLSNNEFFRNIYVENLPEMFRLDDGLYPALTRKYPGFMRLLLLALEPLRKLNKKQLEQKEPLSEAQALQFYQKFLDTYRESLLTLLRLMLDEQPLTDLSLHLKRICETDRELAGDLLLLAVKAAHGFRSKAFRGRPERAEDYFVTCLLEYNADVNVCNEESKTPLYFAHLNHYINMLSLIFKDGKGLASFIEHNEPQYVQARCASATLNALSFSDAYRNFCLAKLFLHYPVLQEKKISQFVTEITLGFAQQDAVNKALVEKFLIELKKSHDFYEKIEALIDFAVNLNERELAKQFEKKMELEDEAEFKLLTTGVAVSDAEEDDAEFEVALIAKLGILPEVIESKSEIKLKMGRP